jgi:glycosyltransferase involved in cell wall biosynthesis
MPKISVILPVYNTEKFIGQAIDSILGQTFQDFELIIIDDCSTDNSVTIIQSYTDKRIIFIGKSQNTGYTNSLNLGISIAKGEYIARMDADDISMSDRFALQIDILDQDRDIVVCGAWGLILGTNDVMKVPEFNAEIIPQLLVQNQMVHPVTMIRKETLVNNGVFYNEKLEPSEDYDLWSRIYEFGKLYNIQKPLLRYRRHNQQVSTIRKSKQQQSDLLIKKDLIKSLEISKSEDFYLLWQKFLRKPHELSIAQFKIIDEAFSKFSAFSKIEPALKNNVLNIYHYYQSTFKNRYYFQSQKYDPTLLLAFSQDSGVKKWGENTILTIKFTIKCLIFYKVKS